jgi:tRNA pseudouridine55 synthase
MSFPGALVLLDKPPGVTSFAALHTIKKKLGTRKVGHTGTLDKFAGGLLVALAGSYTRLNPFISGMDKKYECVFEFGIETSTLDPEGEIVCRRNLPREEELRAAIKKFTGPLMQRPPLFSAVHVDGRRSYQRALLGETSLPAERPVIVYAFEMTGWRPPFLACSVHCGKGTYIRSLARDLAKAVSSCAYVKSLRRTRVGPFCVEEACAPEDFSADRLRCGREFLERLFPGRSAVIRGRYYGSLRQGKALQDEFFENPPAAETGENAILVFTREGQLAAVIEKNSNGYAYRFVCA